MPVRRRSGRFSAPRLTIQTRLARARALSKRSIKAKGQKAWQRRVEVSTVIAGIATAAATCLLSLQIYADAQQRRLETYLLVYDKFLPAISLSEFSLEFDPDSITTFTSTASVQNNMTVKSTVHSTEIYDCSGRPTMLVDKVLVDQNPGAKFLQAPPTSAAGQSFVPFSTTDLRVDVTALGGFSVSDIRKSRLSQVLILKQKITFYVEMPEVAQEIRRSLGDGSLDWLFGSNANLSRAPVASTSVSALGVVAFVDGNPSQAPSGVCKKGKARVLGLTETSAGKDTVAVAP